MNKANMLKLADRLEALDGEVGFNMDFLYLDGGTNIGFADRSGHNCGTIACIAGHAAVMVEGGRPQDPIWDTAVDFLGLERTTACQLFAPAMAHWWKANNQQAAEVLRLVVEDWTPNWAWNYVMGAAT